jgi:hypothetical protein
MKVENTFLSSVPLDILLKCTGKGKSCISKLCIQIYLDFNSLPPPFRVRHVQNQSAFEGYKLM